MDHQVKVNGVRIEPAEVEAALNAHPDIRGAAVGAYTVAERKRLVAHLVAARRIPRDELRSFLRKRLPEPMVPALFVPVDSFPLTSNGKIDRKALPDPEQPDTRTAGRAPGTPRPAPSPNDSWPRCGSSCSRSNGSVCTTTSSHSAAPHSS